MSEPPASPPPPPARPSRLRQVAARLKRAASFASGVLAVLTALLLYNLLFPAAQPLTTREVNEAVAQVLASATAPPANSALVYQAIRPSLVLIQTTLAAAEGAPGDGLGSGVVVSDMGDILTSLHVVAGAETIQLTFADGSQSSAQIAAARPENDIAVLRADQPPDLLVPALLGSAGALRIGDEAIVVGNPFGLHSSLSTGVISGLDRSFQPRNGGQRLRRLIQVDAAVNPGNSGGPLLNRHGEVVGIVTAIVNPTGQEVFIGIGFAVPIEIAGGAAGLPPD